MIACLLLILVLGASGYISILTTELIDYDENTLAHNTVLTGVSLVMFGVACVAAVFLILHILALIF